MTPKELEIRIQDLFEGQLNVDELQELEEELRNNTAARELYQSYARFEGVMHHHASGVDLAKIIPMDEVMRRTRKRQLRLALMSAAAVLLAVMVIMSLILADTTPSLTIRASQGTEFSISHAPSEDQSPEGMSLKPGSRIDLRRGTVELEFVSGVRGIVRGPAALKLSDEHIVELSHGTAWFEVPKEASGFQVVTPDLTLIDLGTEFGIVSRPDAEDEVHVFAGTVKVVNQHYLGEDQTMKTGQAAQATSAGKWESIELSDNPFLKELPESEPNSFSDAIYHDNFSSYRRDNYECVSFNSGRVQPEGYRIDHRNGGVFEMITEGGVQLVLRDPLLKPEQTFRVDVLTDCMGQQAHGMVLTDNPTGKRFLLRCRITANGYKFDFDRGASGSIRWAKITPDTFPQTLWIERISPVQFNWYCGHAVGERSLIAEITLDEDPGPLYTGIQGWQTTAYFDDYAILEGVHPEKDSKAELGPRLTIGK